MHENITCHTCRLALRHRYRQTRQQDTGSATAYVAALANGCHPRFAPTLLRDPRSVQWRGRGLTSFQGPRRRLQELDFES